MNEKINEAKTKKMREQKQKREKNNREISLSQIISLSIDRGSQKRVIARRSTNPFR